MCKLFNAYKDQIKDYCIENNIDFEKVKKLPQCWGKNDIWLQYYDPIKGTKGLNDETPAPIVLKIFIDNGKVTIEQTEHTKKIFVIIDIWHLEKGAYFMPDPYKSVSKDCVLSCTPILA